MLGRHHRRAVAQQSAQWPHLLRCLGDHLDPGLRDRGRDSQLRHSLTGWSDAGARAETDAIPDHVTDKDFRVDLRALPLVTIDGEDARDFDDAVYCQPKPRGGWQLIVAIADVSHYVKPGSALDRQAFRARQLGLLSPTMWCRCCRRSCPTASVRSIPGKIVSVHGLRDAGQPRGRRHQSTSFTKPSCIPTRGSPTPRWRRLSKSGGRPTSANLRDQFAAILPQIDSLHDLYTVLHKRRSQRGAIDFDTQETRILFDRPAQDQSDHSGETHRGAPS